MDEIAAIPEIVRLMYWLGQAACAVMAAAGVLEAGKKGYDLFGVLVIAFASALGGGTVRDLLLDRPVFWIADQTYLSVTLAAGTATFFLARRLSLDPRLFLFPDAIGLALFTVVGTNAALVMGAPWLVASFLGMTTGVLGGILRDVLCNEEPVVFLGPLYATVAWAGGLALVLLYDLGVARTSAALAVGLGIFVARVLAIQFGLSLPRFRAKATSSPK